MRFDIRWHPLAIAAAVRGRLRALVSPGEIDRDLDAEMRFHIDMEVEKLVSRGVEPGEARRAALIAFGGTGQTAEAHRDARGVRAVEDAAGDIRYAWRALCRSPAYAIVALLTLTVAVTIGTSLFTAANAFIFRPLPLPQSDRLVSLFTSDYDGREKRGASSYADIIDFAADADSLAYISAESQVMLALGAGSDMVYVRGAIVSPGYFRVAGVAAAIGQFPFAVSVEAPRIVLSHALWRRSFHGDSAIVGNVIRANGHPFTVAAIAPPEFRGMHRENAVNFWIDGTFAPLLLERDLLRRRGNRSFHGIARLREGATVEALDARLSVTAARLAAANPDTWTDTTGRARTVTVMSERDAHLAGIPRADLVLLVVGVVTFGLGLLAIACMNLATLQLARAAARRREIATRLALGASRGRLIRQLLTESALVVVPGIAAGVALALGALRVVSHYRPIPLPSLDLALDWRAAAFIAAALTITLLVTGLFPALQSARADVLADLKGSGQSGLRAGGARGGLIVAQVALSIVFTAAAGLTAFALMRHANQGRDDARRVLVALVNFLPGAGDGEQVAALVADVHESLRAIPGVEATSASGFIPVRGERRTVGAEVVSGAREGSVHDLDANAVQPGYFDVLRIPFLRGGDFSDRAEGVVIVSRAMAEALWPNEDALGKPLRMVRRTGQWTTVEVIGVVADAAGHVPATDQSHPGLLYVPFDFQGEAELVLHLRASDGEGALATQVSTVLRRYSTYLVAPTVQTLDEHRESTVMPQRILARSSGVLAFLQLLLALAGLSGLVAYATAMRRHEIGIRAALGASRRSVLMLVMRQGVRLMLVGAVIGLGLSLVVAAIIADVLPVTAWIVASGLLVAVGVFAVAGLAAMLVPAKRALDVAPANCLRVE